MAAEGSNAGAKRAAGGTHTGGNAAKRARRSGSGAAAGATAEGATRKGGICPHQRQRSRCKECGGAGICQHQRIRSRCKECREEADTSMPAGLEELAGSAHAAGKDL